MQKIKKVKPDLEYMKKCSACETEKGYDTVAAVYSEYFKNLKFGGSIPGFHWTQVELKF